jgi:hypothetical protein
VLREPREDPHRALLEALAQAGIDPLEIEVGSPAPVAAGRRQDLLIEP